MSSVKDYLVFASVLMVTLLSCAGIALPYPILAPLFMGGQVNGLNSFMGISPEMLMGMALAVYPLGIFIGGTFIGALSDSYGRKKILTLTLFISILGYLLSAYAIVKEQYLLFVFTRFFTGLCEGNLSIARAIALDLGNTIDKTRSMSLISAASFLGWLIGPLAGGYLAVYGAEVAFEAAAGAIAFCMIFVMLVIRETHQVVNDKPFLTLIKSHNSLHLLRIPNVFNIFVFQLMFTLGLNAFYEFYPVWLVMERNYVSSDIGEITAIMTICMTLASVILVTRLKRTFGIQPMLIGGMLTTAVLLAVIPFTEAMPMIVIFALTGVSIAIYNGLLPVFASDINQDVGSGALMGLLTVTFCIASTIIALVGSFALKLHPAMPLYLGSSLVIVSTVLLIRFIRSMPQNSHSNALQETLS
jgi:DHA1 family tetracycline resistance protein-like MFS transporter